MLRKRWACDMGFNVGTLLKDYDVGKLSIATLASHSALQIVHGAKLEGFKTTLIVKRDRLPFYRGFNHLVDEYVVVDEWSDICSQDVVRKLKELNSVIVPHGSYVEYVGIECAENIPIPIFGLRTLFKVEANQKLKMELLSKAGIPIPKTYSLDEAIDKLVIVKLAGAKGGKDYFIAKDKEVITYKLSKLVEQGTIRNFNEALIQEYVLGVTAYYHYFYSPTLNRLEILGADIRYESDIDGLKRLPPNTYLEVGAEPTFTVVGNIPLVLRESLLPKILDYGEKFVKTTKEELPPGVIGPFCLESIITKDAEIIVFEFSGRIVAGTNLYINGSPYSYLYWNEPMSVGRRIAREIKTAIDKGMLEKVLT